MLQKTMFLGRVLTVLAISSVVVLAGCSSGTHVARTDPDEQIDLSGNWNDTDSRQMAQALVDQITESSAWLRIHNELEGSRPALIVGPIKNKTPEHIPMKTLTADLEKSFINSGSVKMVASAEEREAVRDERADQQQYSAPETMAHWGREHGADYMLLGELNAIFDRDGGEEVKYYQLDCYLVDLEDNSKVWVGDHRIKKIVTRSGYGP